MDPLLILGGMAALLLLVFFILLVVLMTSPKPQPNQRQKKVREDIKKIRSQIIDEDAEE